MATAEERPIERKLTTILSADIVGYSHLMERNEARTLARLRDARATLKALIDRHRGRIANTAGDSVLADFPSAVEAVACAVEIQSELAAKASERPSEEALRFRIGINLGDVMIEPDGDLFGDGVNVAARLQSQAEPGGILVSKNVVDLVQNKLDVRFHSLGEQQLKNIAHKVEAFTVKSGSSSVFDRVISSDVPQFSQVPPRAKGVVLLVAFVLIMAGQIFDNFLGWLGIAVYWFGASQYINERVKLPANRQSFHLAKFVIGLALINFLSGGSDPWFIYPAVPIILYGLWQRRKFQQSE